MQWFHVYTYMNVLSVVHGTLVQWSGTGCFFFTGPTQKSSKYGTGPPQQEKMTKYTGPTQDLLTQKRSKYGTGTPQQDKMTKYTGPTQDT